MSHRPKSARERLSTTPPEPLPEGRRRLKRRAILILGMHRSGTSAFTRVLSLLGADLPANLLPARPDNEAGFWESRDIAGIHDELLESAGSSWDDFSAFPEDWHLSQPASALRKRVLEVLERDFGNSSLFVLKDPRMCRFVPFWLSVLEEFGAEPVFLIPIRHPLEVTASLKALHGFLPAKSLLLWLRHVLDAERDTRGYKRAFSHYDALLRDWRGVAKSVSRHLGVSWPRQSHLPDVEVEEFLSPRHRHHIFERRDLEARSDVVTWVKQAYATLLEAGGGNADHLAGPLDAIRSELEEADRAFAPLLEDLRLRVSGLQSRCAALEGEVQKLQEDSEHIFEGVRVMSAQINLLKQVPFASQIWRLIRKFWYPHLTRSNRGD